MGISGKIEEVFEYMIKMRLLKNGEILQPIAGAIYCRKWPFYNSLILITIKILDDSHDKSRLACIECFPAIRPNVKA